MNETFYFFMGLVLIALIGSFTYLIFRIIKDFYRVFLECINDILIAHKQKNKKEFFRNIKKLLRLVLHFSAILVCLYMIFKK